MNVISYIYLQDNTYGAKYWWKMWHKIKTRKSLIRHGTQCVIQCPTNIAQSLQENAITIFGPLLYNSLQKISVRHRSVRTEKFKFERDKFLEHIPDDPNDQHMSPHTEATCSILDQMTHLRAQGIYQSGGVLDSATKQSGRLRNLSKYPSIHVYFHLFPKISFPLTAGFDCCRRVRG